MPRKTKKAEQKAPDMENVLDSFESWLERQAPKHARARHGFSPDEKIGSS